MQQVQGFSLIEVLISLIITSVIILSLLFSQLQATKNINDDIFKLAALTLMINTSECLLAGNSSDSTHFSEMAKEILPNGSGSILTTDNDYQLNLTWNNSQATSLHALEFIF